MHAGALVFNPEKWCSGIGVFELTTAVAVQTGFEKSSDIGQNDQTVFETIPQLSDLRFAAKKLLRCIHINV